MQRGEQTFYGNKTFDHNVQFNGNATFFGPILGGPRVGYDYFLHSGTGHDGGGYGKTWLKPFATLDYALSKITADQGSRLWIMPKHAETLTGAGGLTLDVAGLDIIGLGRYDSRPRFLMDGDAITGLVTAANVSLSNCVFAAGHADIASCLLVTAKGFGLYNNRFELNTTEENFVKIVDAGVSTDNAFDGLEVIGNVIDFAGDAGELTPIILNKNSESVRIIGNKIYGDFDTTPYAVIYSPNTEVHADIEIAYNHIHNLHDANAVVGISVGSTGSTGFMHHNYVYALDVAGATPFVTAATGISVFENYYNHVGSTTSAYLHPAAGSIG